MFCPQCGYKNNDKAKFCEQCGIPQKEHVISATSVTGNRDSELETASKIPTKKNKKIKAILIIMVTVLLIGLVVGGYFFITHQQKAKADETYITQISAASQAENSKNYDAAIIDYQAAIQQRPDDAKAYIGLADAYIGKNDYENAAKILRTGYTKTNSTEIDSKLSEVNKMLEKIKAADVAKKKVEDNAKAKETEYNSQLALGDKYLATKDYDNAIVAYQKAMDAKPNETKPYIGLADANKDNNNLSHAIEILEKGYKQTQNNNIKLKLSLFNDLNGWQDAYRAEIMKCDSSFLFSLYDMDNDGVPEITLPANYWGSRSLYTYKDGSLKKIAEMVGVEYYKYGDHQLIGKFGDGGINELQLNSLINGKLDRKVPFASKENINDGTISYTVYEKKVSESEAEYVFKQLTSGEKLKTGKASDVTSTTDLAQYITP